MLNIKIIIIIIIIIIGIFFDEQSLYPFWILI